MFYKTNTRHLILSFLIASFINYPNDHVRYIQPVSEFDYGYFLKYFLFRNVLK
jgi:hypothetical protein